MLRHASRIAAAALTGTLCLSSGCKQATSPSDPRSEVAFSASASTQVLTIPAAGRITPTTQADIEACLGETVTFAGHGVLVIHRTTHPDGSSTLLVHANPQGAVGVGSSSGTTYRLAASDLFSQIVAPSGAFTSSFVGNLHVIGPGQSPGFFGHILLHVTVTPAGDITAESELIDIRCV
jgi:hypothetical protein